MARSSKWKEGMLKDAKVIARRCHLGMGDQVIGLKVLVYHFLDHQLDQTGVMGSPEGILAFLYKVFDRVPHMKEHIIHPDTLYVIRLRWRKDKGIQQGEHDCRTYCTQEDRDMHDGHHLRDRRRAS